MKKITLFAFVTVLISLSFSTVFANENAQTFQGSPFTDVAFEGDHIKVKHENEYYYVISIDGVKSEAIVEACKAKYAADCEVQFAENFVALLTELALPGSDWAQVDALAQVDVELYFFATHRVTVFEDVAVTLDKRNEVIVNRMLRGL